MRIYRIISGLIIVISLSACGTSKSAYYKDKEWLKYEPTPSSEIVHTLWLIGDTGELDDEIDNRNFTVEGMASMMDMKDSTSVAMFLGDNIYPHGLPEEGALDRRLGEAIVRAQLEPIQSFKGTTFFIPGNHDWNKHKSGGREAMIRQENYIEDYFPYVDRIQVVPDNACGGPYVYKVTDGLIYIMIDSQWWMHDWSLEKNMNRGCEVKSREALLKKVEELMITYRDAQVIFMLHHPIKTNGAHGGKYSWKDHIFPLAHYKVWLPLPVIGSLYPLIRRARTTPQDATNSHNQDLIYALRDIAIKHDLNCVFASGHEHGLQYFEEGKIKYVVSGAGGKTDFIQKGGDALYARSKRGFAKIEFYKNNESWLYFYTVDGQDIVPALEFRKQLREPSGPSE